MSLVFANFAEMETFVRELGSWCESDDGKLQSELSKKFNQFTKEAQELGFDAESSAMLSFSLLLLSGASAISSRYQQSILPKNRQSEAFRFVSWISQYAAAEALLYDCLSCRDERSVNHLFKVSKSVSAALGATLSLQDSAGGIQSAHLLGSYLKSLTILAEKLEASFTSANIKTTKNILNEFR